MHLQHIPEFKGKGWVTYKSIRHTFHLVSSLQILAKLAELNFLNTIKDLRT